MGSLQGEREGVPEGATAPGGAVGETLKFVLPNPARCVLPSQMGRHTSSGEAIGGDLDRMVWTGRVDLDQCAHRLPDGLDGVCGVATSQAPVAEVFSDSVGDVIERQFHG